jgi:hypothetical protein
MAASRVSVRRAHWHRVYSNSAIPHVLAPRAKDMAACSFDRLFDIHEAP